MPNSIENSKLFCLEGVNDVEVDINSPVIPALEALAMREAITSIYKTCDSIEGFEESLSTLLYEDRHFKDYEILYLVFKGAGNDITLDQYKYTLEEIAEIFEGKLRGKILHFANTNTLNLDEEQAQYFLDVTGAKGVSGYPNKSSVSSLRLDMEYFALCQEYDNVVDITEELYHKYYALCKTLGFTMYY